MDNVLQDMVHRLRAIELVLRAQNELLTRMLAKMEETDSRPRTRDTEDEERIRKRA